MPDEFVLATVRKIFPYGAILSLNEYNNAEAFLHISEVSTGWIRNIHEHLKDGQVIVVKIVNVDHAKRQIDASLKRVSEGEKNRKLQQYQAAKRATKLFERAALKVGRTLNQAYAEAGNVLIQEYGDLYSAFEDMSTGTIKAKVPKAWEKVLLEVAKQEIKVKKATVRGIITLQSYSSHGLQDVKSIFSAITPAEYGGQVSFHYVGAPHYYVDVTAPDFKQADKILAKIGGKIESLAKGSDYNFSMEKQEDK